MLMSGYIAGNLKFISLDIQKFVFVGFMCIKSWRICKKSYPEYQQSYYSYSNSLIIFCCDCATHINHWLILSFIWLQCFLIMIFSLADYEGFHSTYLFIYIVMLICGEPVDWCEIKYRWIPWCLYSLGRKSFILCKWGSFIDPLESLPVLQHIELIAYINSRIAGITGKV